MKLKLRKKQKKVLGITLALIFIGSSVGVFTKMQIDKVESQMQEQENKSNDLLRSVLVPIQDIEQGMQLTENMFRQEVISYSLDDTMFISDSDFGSYASTTLLANQPVLDSQIHQIVIDDTLRVEEYNMFLLQTDLKENHYVDVRIDYPTGENYTILSKKKVHKLDKENNIVWLALNEKEITLISSAIKDSYITGSKIYVNRYVDSTVQESNEVNYVPRQDVLEYIEINDNIPYSEKDKLYMDTMKARRQMLDSRLTTQPDEEKSKVEAGVQEEETKNKGTIFYNIENVENGEEIVNEETNSN